MSWTQPAYEAVARLVGVRTGLTFVNREASVELGIRRAMARAGLTDTSTYLNRLANDDRVLDDLVSDLTVGETYFFREPDHFQRIRREVLPDIRRRRGLDHLVRAWSAGCASGEEAYTLAIVFEQEGLGQRSHVLATDISQKALTAARRGVCSDWSLRGESGTDALPYLIRSGASYKVVDAIRRQVSFAPLNLALDVYPSFTNGTWGMDLIMCRNVLIYLGKETVQGVAQRLFRSLNEGGWLITASADPPLWDSAPFEVVATHQGVVYRRPVEVKPQGEVLRTLGVPAVDDPKPQGEVLRTLGIPVVEDPKPQGEVLRTLEIPVVEDPRGSEYLTLGPGTRLQRVRALANLEPVKALTECARLLLESPFEIELNYLHAMLLLDLGKTQQAIEAMKRLIYLDRSLAIAHFNLASMLRRHGDLDGARRGYRNSRDLCAGLAADAVLPLGEGELAGRLAELAGAELASLEDGP